MQMKQMEMGVTIAKLKKDGYVLLMELNLRVRPCVEMDL